MFVVLLECDPALFDVSYLPTKREVEFQDWSPVLQLVRSALEPHLPAHPSAPDFGLCRQSAADADAHAIRLVCHATGSGSSPPRETLPTGTWNQGGTEHATASDVLPHVPPASASKAQPTLPLCRRQQASSARVPDRATAPPLHGRGSASLTTAAGPPVRPREDRVSRGGEHTQVCATSEGPGHAGRGHLLVTIPVDGLDCQTGSMTAWPAALLESSVAITGQEGGARPDGCGTGFVPEIVAQEHSTARGPVAGPGQRCRGAGVKIRIDSGPGGVLGGGSASGACSRSDDGTGMASTSSNNSRASGVHGPEGPGYQRLGRPIPTEGVCPEPGSGAPPRSGPTSLRVRAHGATGHAVKRRRLSMTDVSAGSGCGTATDVGICNGTRAGAGTLTAAGGAGVSTTGGTNGDANTGHDTAAVANASALSAAPSTVPTPLQCAVTTEAVDDTRGLCHPPKFGKWRVPPPHLPDLSGAASLPNCENLEQEPAVQQATILSQLMSDGLFVLLVKGQSEWCGTKVRLNWMLRSGSRGVGSDVFCGRKGPQEL